MSLFLHQRRQAFFLLFGVLIFTGCQRKTFELTASLPDPLPPANSTSTVRLVGFTQDEISTLNSLQLVDEHPLYVMHYVGSYPDITLAAPGAIGTERSIAGESTPPSWACSLFATLADPASGVLGRNFDWEFSPALLLFTDPADAYASVSIVDLAYFFDSTTSARLIDLDLNKRSPLLNTPSLPFDGMNERGLAIGMAAVPYSRTPENPNLESAGSLQIIRMILDHAASVEEALSIMRDVNIIWGGGPPLHYLIADTNGTAALVEFIDGEMVVFTNTDPWHQATNFLLGNASSPADGLCHRYDLLQERLQHKQGELTPAEAMALLADVSQNSTQWSVVYQLYTGNITIAMERMYSRILTFHLENRTPEN